VRIYVAGPYCPKTDNMHDAARIAQHNVNRAIEVAYALIAKGHLVFVPHLSHYLHIHYSFRRDLGNYYLRYDFSIINKWAEALYYICSSPGADKELELAKSLKLKIYYKLWEVPKCGTIKL